jgi:hypothetical protein
MNQAQQQEIGTAAIQLANTAGMEETMETKTRPFNELAGKTALPLLPPFRRRCALTAEERSHDWLTLIEFCRFVVTHKNWTKDELADLLSRAPNWCYFTDLRAARRYAKGLYQDLFHVLASNGVQHNYPKYPHMKMKETV